GTFLVRSGVLTSVHAFATDPERGVFILALLIIVVGGSLALFAYRGPQLKTGGLFQPVSREGSLLLNNLLMTTAAAAVLLGTLYPLFIDSLDLGKVSVGPPFFNAVFLPLMFPMVLVMAIGPFLTWKRGNLTKTLVKLWPAAVGAGGMAVIALYAYADGPLLAVAGLALAGWLMVGTLIEFANRIRLFKAPLTESLRRLVRMPRSGWGMSLAHFGMAITVVGITGASAWKQEHIQVMNPGDSVEISGYTYHFEGAKRVREENYFATEGTFRVTRDDETITTLHPQKRQYPVSQRDTTEAGIYSLFLGDLYAVIGDKSGDQGGYVTRLYFNPLVAWLWMGAAVMVLGGILSLSDRRLRVGAPARAKTRAVPAQA
ncbi:MAG: heme lyase CcmF/NrfE family subunit, partial [Magnetospiraceae bacterium]